MSTGRKPSDLDRKRAAALVGRTIADRYRVVELIALGGMGAVYLGEHVHMRKKVAIKVLHPTMSALQDLVARFEREAIAGAHIDHPNVASATDFGQFDEGWHYLVLEYVRGVTLNDVIARGPMSVTRALHIGAQIAAGLEASHRMGVIHRDIKPRNVMLVEKNDDLVKLIDYGFARVPLDRLSTSEVSEEALSITGAGVAFGTVAYMPPEIAEGMDHVDERSDLYSLGIILYELFTGRHPFDGIETGELFLQQRTEQPPPMRLRKPGVRVPQGVEALVMRLLRKDPAQRFQTATELVAALEQALHDVQPDGGGMIPWSSQLPSSAAFGRAIPEPPTSQPGGMAQPPPLPEVPYEPRLVKPNGGRSPLSVILIAIIVLAGCVYAVLSLRDYRESLQAPTPIPVDEIEVDLSAIPPPLQSVVPEASASTVAPPSTPAHEPSGSTLDVELHDAAGWRVRLGNSFVNKKWSEGADAVIALSALDPDAFGEDSVRIAAAAVAVRIEFSDKAKADLVFDKLAHQLGPNGLDVLYEMVSAHGGSKGAERALTTLARPEVIRDATAALAIAVTLRTTDCEDRPKLFGRAADVGDERALAVMDRWRGAGCKPKEGHCCFHDSDDLKRATGKLRGRLGG